MVIKKVINSVLIAFLIMKKIRKTDKATFFSVTESILQREESGFMYKMKLQQSQ